MNFSDTPDIAANPDTHAARELDSSTATGADGSNSANPDTALPSASR